MISGKKAQYIVEEMTKIIDRPINFMNDQGVIIASTDKFRIGSVHEGASVVLRTRKELIIGTNDRLEGTKEGINLPVYFENRVIGVIGITGTDQEVIKMGEIIRKMTEILVKEEIIDRQSELVNQSREVFIREWLEGQWSDDKDLSARGWTLNINVHLPRVAVTFLFTSPSELRENQQVVQLQQNQNQFYTQLREAIKFNDQDIIVPIGMMQFIVLLTWPENRADKKKDFISHKIQYLIRQLADLKGYSVKVGVGGFYESFKSIPHSYQESKKAGIHARGANDSKFVFFDDLELELLLDGIPEELRDKYLNKILDVGANPQLEEMLETLRQFFIYNQSINKTADHLFIHKNTLQYRLNKIKELTGYDPRVFEEGVLLYLALYFISGK
ncbi:CdaR family transcriptional regulator [Paenibacillus glycanilyticus]|uniref:CdaR family transcriptional regulator n=1 Tax=Paenibacillus glycanilyticus TaxID=126569 RepID=A0ABQ6G6U9_9BACL|nr:sugar diacid recognition domain-containing protein [Paenibacillus glycanilyticus]GLX66679.1 CdaR family transcriptional regulator [Paenibacillus glycanilyticus]